MANSRLSSLLKLIEASGELEIGRTTKDESALYGSWYGFSWLSGYVYGDSASEVIDELLLEADHHAWKRLPVVQIQQRKSYIERRRKRRKPRNTRRK